MKILRRQKYPAAKKLLAIFRPFHGQKRGNGGITAVPRASFTPGKAFSQVPGDALRMTAEYFKELTENGGPLTKMLYRYTQAL